MDKLNEWIKISIELKDLKNREMTLRKELCTSIFEGIQAPGRKRFTVDNYDLVAENTINHKLDTKSSTEMFSELTEPEKNAIRWKAELNLREYKKLPDDCLLQECVTITPGTPRLSLKIKK